jgi:ribosomal protein S12 methylthiotransferase
VLIDKKEAGRYLGRTEFDSVEVDNEVVISGDKRLPIGEFVNVKITRAYDYDLEGQGRIHEQMSIGTYEYMK